jgi:hypothetical protein
LEEQVELFLVILLGIVFWAIVVVVNGDRDKKARREAGIAYIDSLEELKQSPTDANLKQETLALGRRYSNLTRNNMGNTIFDEVALMNDINAACAAANVTPELNSTVPTSVESRLRTLDELKDKGLINTAEYDKRRSEIMSSI